MFLAIIQSGLGFSKNYTGVLQEPVNLGAWLYHGKCRRCHGNAGDAGLADNFDEKDELIDAFTGGGNCSENWARARDSRPGLKKDELSALAEFLFALENQGKLNLPELPAQPKDKDFLLAVTKENSLSFDSRENQVPEFPQYLTDVLNGNQIAKGGWLYINNCYRCHLTYAEGRMGRGFEKEIIQMIVTEGKTSTQMRPFSKVLGGNLRKNEIMAIVDYMLKWEADGEPPAIASELMTPPSFDPDQFKPMRLTRFRVIRGDREAGQKLFAHNCTGCHGRAGEGIIGPELSEFESLRPDLYVKSVLKKGVPGSLMDSWDQSKKGAFPAKAIDDVTAFLTAPVQ